MQRLAHAATRCAWASPRGRGAAISATWTDARHSCQDVIANASSCECVAGRAKASGYYVNSILANREVTRDGSDEAFLLDTEGWRHIVVAAGPRISGDRTNHAPIHSQCGACSRGSLLRADIDRHIRDFFGGGEAVDQRRRAAADACRNRASHTIKKITRPCSIRSGPPPCMRTTAASHTGEAARMCSLKSEAICGSVKALPIRPRRRNART